MVDDKPKKAHNAPQAGKKADKKEKKAGKHSNAPKNAKVNQKKKKKKKKRLFFSLIDLVTNKKIITI